MLYYSCIGPSVWYLWSVSWTIVLMLLYYRPHALQYHHTPRCLGWFWHCRGSTHSRPLSSWHSMMKNGQPSVLTVASFTTPIRNRQPQCQKQLTTDLAQNPISERCATEILGASRRCEEPGRHSRRILSHPQTALLMFVVISWTEYPITFKRTNQICYYQPVPWLPGGARGNISRVWTFLRLAAMSHGV